MSEGHFESFLSCVNGTKVCSPFQMQQTDGEADAEQGDDGVGAGGVGGLLHGAHVAAEQGQLAERGH